MPYTLIHSEQVWKAEVKSQLPGSARLFCIHGTLSFKCMQSQSCLQHVEDKFGILCTLQVIWKCKALLKQNDSIMKNCIAATARLPPECLRTTRSVPCGRLTTRDGPSKPGNNASVPAIQKPLESGPCDRPANTHGRASEPCDRKCSQLPYRSG